MNMNSEDQKLWNMLGQATRVSAPADFSRSVMSRLEEATPCESWWHQHRGWMSMAAAVVAMLGITSLVYTNINAQQEEELLAQVDEATVLDVAYISLGDDTLRDAVSVLATDDALAFVSGEQSLVDLIL
jgi:hypothetical protein